MPAFAIDLLVKVLPYILGALALIGAYFGIKQKGVQQERAKQQAAQAKAVAQVQQQVQVAVSKDQQIDKKVQNEVAKIEEAKPAPAPIGSLKPGDEFKF